MNKNTKDLKPALALALEALESCNAGDYSTGHVIHPSFDEDAVNKAIEAIDALAEQHEQEPSLAAAWQQGYDQGVADERTSEANIGIAGFDAKVNPARNNPYSAEQPAYRAVKTFHEGKPVYVAEQPAQDDPCIDGSCSCCWSHLDGGPAPAPEVREQQDPNYSICPTCGGMASDPIVPPSARQQEPVAWKDEQGNVRMTLDSGEIQSSVGYVYSVHGERIKNACIKSDIPNGTPLYTRPQPAAQWVGLTDEHRREVINAAWNGYLRGEGNDSFSWHLTQVIEAKLREKNEHREKNA